MKKVFYSSILALFVFSVLVMPVSAAKFEAGQQYVLGKDQSINENLYAAGTNIAIKGNLEGDLVTAGQTINVFGKVAQDITAAGNNLNFMGEIGGDLRAAGAFVNIDSNIIGDMLAAGGQIQVVKDANLAGTIRLAGGIINIEGNILGPAKIKGDKVIINGRVARDAEITASKELVIGKDAVIDGKITYKSPKEAIIESGAKVNTELSFIKIEQKFKPGVRKGAMLAIFTTLWFVKLLMLLAAALLLFGFFRKWLSGFVRETISNFGRELVSGFIFLFIVPIAVVFLFITIIGILPGIAGILAYVLFLIFAGVLSGVVFGSWLGKYLFKAENYVVDWKTIIGGIILFQLVCLIPFVGWIIGFVVFLACLGRLYYAAYQNFWLGK